MGSKVARSGRLSIGLAAGDACAFSQPCRLHGAIADLQAGAHGAISTMFSVTTPRRRSVLTATPLRVRWVLGYCPKSLRSTVFRRCPSAQNDQASDNLATCSYQPCCRPGGHPISRLAVLRPAVGLHRLVFKHAGSKEYPMPMRCMPALPLDKAATGSATKICEPTPGFSDLGGRLHNDTRPRTLKAVIRRLKKDPRAGKPRAGSPANGLFPNETARLCQPLKASHIAVPGSEVSADTDVDP